MAKEFKLNFTAEDINAKLNVIDGNSTYDTSTEVDTKINNSKVQPDFTQTDDTQADYIKNKPSISETVEESSSDLITSGAVYSAIQEAIGDIDTVINQINTLIDGET